MSKHQQLRKLEAIERKAWNAKMSPNAFFEDICTIYGQEGKLEIEWRLAAGACFDYREKHGLLGMTWKQIEEMV